MDQLRALADAHRFPVVINETLGACINQNTLPSSDLSIISLTKYFSGSSDVMGGAFIINPESHFANRFTELLKTLHETEAFYDAPEITKGPNLGTCFSLCCPFILLAHYDELEWTESAGASRYLIRISAGLDPPPPNELITRLGRAF